jgi:FAD:protein FMN transferase
MKSLTIWGILCWVLAASWPVSAKSASGEAGLTRFKYTQLHMGVQVSITLYAPDQATAERVATAGFKRFAELENVMSDYRPTSEVMRLCAKSGGPPVEVSPDLLKVLERAVKVAGQSDGAFDVTVGPLVQLWRKARQTGQLPSTEVLEKARALVGWRKVRLEKETRSVALLVPGMRLDLGGIAKGYAGDEAIRALKENGVGRAMVEAGGDIVLSGPPPGQKGWRIQVDTTQPPKVMQLADCAVSTSGDVNQYVEIAGKRYSHIVDPRTGLGLTSRTAVTVIAQDGLTSDSLTKVVSVLGADKGLPIVRRYREARAYTKRATDSANRLLPIP